MIDVIVDHILHIDYMLDITTSDLRDHHYIGVPYCLIAYIAALVALSITTLLLTIEACKAQTKTQAPAPKLMIEDFDISRSTDNVPVTTIIPEKNEVYSIKL